MTTATELLKRALYELSWLKSPGIVDDIVAYLSAEPEAKIIETLRDENFKLASGQCTEGGPWGDEGGTPYCKYARPEPEAEPVGYAVKMIPRGLHFIGFVGEEETDEEIEEYGWDQIVPLYTNPSPARKPMTEEEIDEELETNEYYCAKSFADGVRFAEKHHGIGGDDE
jgi:hypothetical protein